MPNTHSSPIAVRSADQFCSRSAGLVAALLATAALVGCNSKDYTAVALTSTGNIIEFATNKPTDITNSATVNGLTGSDTLVQIAYLPAATTSTAATQLYGVTSQNEICLVDPLTATVSTCTAAFIGDRLSNVSSSFDPTSSTLRVIANDAAQSGGHFNALIYPSSGTLVPTQQSNTLSYSDGTSGTPQINAIGYNNAIANATSTTLYALDVNNQSLDQIGDSNAGNASSVTSGGVKTIGPTDVSFTANVGFAIAPQDGTAYAVLGNAASLYTIDLGTGLATLVGEVHNADYTLISLAIAPNS